MKKMIDGVPTPIHSVGGNPPVEMFVIAEDDVEEPKQKKHSFRQRELEKLKKEQSKKEQQQQLLDDINASVNFETTKFKDSKAVMEKINAFIGGGE